MATYLSNAFSFNMVSNLKIGSLFFRDMELEEVKNKLQKGFTNTVGHADIAAVISDQIGIEVKPNRVNNSLNVGDHLVIAQYIGPRLQEGATKLPEGAKIKWILVVVEEK